MRKKPWIILLQQEVKRMYKAHWNMTCNPFSKNNNQYCYESEDYHNAHSRLKYLTTQKGFGLFTGQPGTGKTFTLRA